MSSPVSSFHQQSRRSSSAPQALSKGQACLECRQRKIRCDGVRPICGPCLRAQRLQECQFEGQARSRTQFLEDTILDLKARVYELEHQGSGGILSSSTVFLHDPHAPVSSPVSLSQAYHISSETVALLLDKFFQHVQALPWFLHEGRVRRGLSLESEDTGHPIKVLRTVVLLWGSVFLSRSPLEVESVDCESILSQALSEVGQSLVNASAQHIVQLIQAHILLALYLGDRCRFLESRFHADAAASLAVRIGLHKIRAQQGWAQYPSYLDSIDLSLLEPSDAVEEGERIGAFWASFCQDSVYAVLFGVPSLIAGTNDAAAQVDTSWPLGMISYEQERMHVDLRTSGTLSSFFSGIVNGWPWESEVPSVLCRASALFERATRLVGAWRPYLPDSAAYYADFVALDARIDEFQAHLPSLIADPTHRLHLAYSLAYASSIQLHSVFTQQAAVSRAKCLEAARGTLYVSSAVQLQTFFFVDPILGSIWAAACRVLIGELTMLRAQLFEPAASSIMTETELVSVLDGILALMASFSSTSEATNFHFSRIQQECMVLG